MLELFQWNDGPDVSKERIAEEMADVLIYVLSLADVTDIDVCKAVSDKIKKNEEKYPLNGSKSF